jgi:hypothetical protein
MKRRSKLQEEMRAGGIADMLFPLGQRSGLCIDDGAAVARQHDALAPGADGLTRKHENRLAIYRRPARPCRDENAVFDFDGTQVRRQGRLGGGGIADIHAQRRQLGGKPP